jgi:hypothetical protein
LPPILAYELFSLSFLVVGGKPVKPALDEHGMVMIPLQQPTGKDDKGQTTFCVELVYVTTIDELESGELKLLFPFCDIPMTQLLAEVYLPSNYVYGEFKGMREVNYWSKEPPASVVAPPQQLQMVQDQLFEKQEMMERVEMAVEKINWKSEALGFHSFFFLFSYLFVFVGNRYSTKGGRGRGRAGVVPVRVEVPTSGTRFMFEQLLVDQKSVELSVDYQQGEENNEAMAKYRKEQTTRHRRGCCRNCCRNWCCCCY